MAKAVLLRQTVTLKKKIQIIMEIKLYCLAGRENEHLAKSRYHAHWKYFEINDLSVQLIEKGNVYFQEHMEIFSVTV